MSVASVGRQRNGGGVVDADVDAAEGLGRLGDGGLHLLLVADVADQRQRAAAGLLDLGGGGVDRAFELGIGLGGLGGDGDVGAVARGALGDGEADAAAGAGDEQRLAFEGGHARVLAGGSSGWSRIVPTQSHAIAVQVGRHA